MKIRYMGDVRSLVAILLKNGHRITVTPKGLRSDRDISDPYPCYTVECEEVAQEQPEGGATDGQGDS